MRKPKRLDGKKKLIAFTSKMETDMRSFCRNKGIKSESELIRQAVSNYIYHDGKNKSFKPGARRQLKELLAELGEMEFKIAASFLNEKIKTP